MDSPVAEIIRVAPGRHWHALEDDLVVGRGHALHRADGRRLISVDTWRDDVFAVLAEALVHDLGSPVYTVVDDDDREVLGRWASAGFRDHRREDVLAVPTTGSRAQLPTGITVVQASSLMVDDVRVLDERLRPMVPGAAPWENTPEQFEEPALVALAGVEPVGLARVGRAGRRSRLVLVGVLEPYRRQGIARALLNRAFQPLRDRGITHVTADVDETAVAAQALLRGLGAERVAGTVELVR